MDSISFIFGALTGVGILVISFGCVRMFVHGLKKRSFIWVITSLVLSGATCLLVQFIVSSFQTVPIPTPVVSPAPSAAH